MNESPVAIEFTWQEHDFLNDILCHASDGMYVACPSFQELPEDSEFRQRFKMLEDIRHKSNQLWNQRWNDSHD